MREANQGYCASVAFTQEAEAMEAMQACTENNLVRLCEGINLVILSSLFIHMLHDRSIERIETKEKKKSQEKVAKMKTQLRNYIPINKQTREGETERIEPKSQ